MTCETDRLLLQCTLFHITIRYDTIEEFNVDSKAEYRVFSLI